MNGLFQPGLCLSQRVIQTKSAVFVFLVSEIDLYSRRRVNMFFIPNV